MMVIDNTQTTKSALSAEQVQQYLQQLPGWSLADTGKAIKKRFEFSNFAQALAYTNMLGEKAEAMNHHPDLALGWGYVEVTFTTHDIGGLQQNDFVMANEAEAIFQKNAA